MLRKLLIVLLVIPSVLTAQKPDTLKARTTRQWTLSPDYTEEVKIPLDTAFSLFHRNRRADKYSPFNAYPGNYGLPLYQINFFDRSDDPDMFLYRYYYPFMHLPSNPVFTNTHVPFTEFTWSYGGPRDQAEQTFRIRHSQNVNRFLNFGLIYDIVYCLGQYTYQRSDDKTFTLYGSYTGEKYKVYISGGINNLRAYENGGITDPTQLRTYKTPEIETRLGKLNVANDFLMNTNLLLVQRYTLGKKREVVQDTTSGGKSKNAFWLTGTFSHILIYEGNKKDYTDNDPGSGFYKNVFFNDTTTFDSLAVRSLKNTIRFDFSTNETRKFRLGGGFGIRNELFRYSQFSQIHVRYPSDTSAVWNQKNNAIVGRLFNDIGNKLRWTAIGELFISGYRAGDFKLEGEINKTLAWKKGNATWIIFGKVTNLQPSVWYDRWLSNNFTWNNNFSKEFRINVGTEFLYPVRKAELKFNYAIINNYMDFGTDTLPYQNKGGLSVAALYLKKEFSLGKFHLSNDILIQKSTDRNILDLPLLTIRSAGFLSTTFISS